MDRADQPKHVSSESQYNMGLGERYSPVAVPLPQMVGILRGNNGN